MKRRDFLKAAAISTTTLSGCGGRQFNENLIKVPEVSAEQAKDKYKGRSTVALINCPSYDEDLVARLHAYKDRVGLPSLTGKTVVLKPNMVEFRADKPIDTNPKVVSAVIQFAKDLGAAQITVAEGPGHMRDTEYLLEVTGIGQAARLADVPFVDLNLDDLVKVPNPHGFTSLKHFYMPRTIMDADVVVSVPKLKMHHWAGVTCSMKNLFGTVPGRKYGWPKNLLHFKGIPASIIDLVRIVRPAFAVVDAIVAMEGDGPINGTAIDTGFLAMGCDLAALDATCTRVTSVSPEELTYMILAGKVIGNIDPEMIDIVGQTIASLKKPFDQPITFKNKELIARAAHEGS
ncbi:MAG: DUF362 domain-containing protein [Candidatus Obscuribacterales bacterium]|nr:DUF362 domain-containing protein [Candidatus Obscuribacterales bacterium]